MRLGIWIGTLQLLVACGSGPGGQPTDAGIDSPPGDSQAQPGFKEDPRPAGAVVYLTLDLADPAAPVASLWASQLGSVFGLALQLELDGEHLAAQAPKASSWLGADAPAEARYLTVARAGAVSLGAVRRGPAAGERAISEPVKLAVIPLKVVSPGSSRLEIKELQVRRSDGRFVPVKAAGGELTVGGAP